MKPIPIGGSSAQKQREDAQAKDGVQDAGGSETHYELVLTEEAMQEWRDAEAREVAQNKARLAGTGMVGTLLDTKV